MELGDALDVWNETFKDEEGAKERESLRTQMLIKITDTQQKSPLKHTPEEWQALRNKINSGSH